MKVIFSAVRFILLITITLIIVTFASGFIADSRRARSLFFRPYTTIVQNALSDSVKENDISDSDEIAFRSIAKRYLSSKFQECNADGNECKAFRGIDEASKTLACY